MTRMQRKLPVWEVLQGSSVSGGDGKILLAWDAPSTERQQLPSYPAPATPTLNGSQEKKTFKTKEPSHFYFSQAL